MVINNISFHKNTKIKGLIESVGCSTPYLPTYSPDLNSTEHYWFKIKHEIQKFNGNFETFCNAVYYVLQKVTTLSI